LDGVVSIVVRRAQALQLNRTPPVSNSPVASTHIQPGTKTCPEVITVKKCQYASTCHTSDHS